MSLYNRVSLLLVLSVVTSVIITIYVQGSTLARFHEFYNPGKSEQVLVKMRDYVRKEYRSVGNNDQSVSEIRELSDILDKNILINEELDILKKELQFRIAAGSIFPSLIILLVFFLSGRFILSSLFKPVNILAGSMKQYSSGDDSVFPMPVTGIPESRMLLSATNSMIETIRQQKEIISVQGRFLGWKDSAMEIVHEIKNILTPARLAAESAIENVILDDSDRVISDMDKVLNSLGALERMSRSLRELSGMCVPSPVKLDLFALAGDAVDFFTSQFENIRFSGEHVDVICDRDLLQSALHNLIVNAIEAVADSLEGQVIIRVGKKNDRAFLECSDNGPGIDDSIRDRIFRPNFTTKEKGTGFGLYFVKRVLDNHGYSIETEKGPHGTGTTMRMVF